MSLTGTETEVNETERISIYDSFGLLKEWKNQFVVSYTDRVLVTVATMVYMKEPKPKYVVLN